MVVDEGKLLANEVREVLLQGKWIANTNYREQLNQVVWEQAIQKVDGLNSIAELTFHINYYLGGVLQVFNGGALEIRDEFSFDMPKINTKTDWDTLVASFIQNAQEFADKVAQMDNGLLAQTFVKKEYGDYKKNIQGAIAHSYYHLGQIVLLRRLLA